MPEKQPLIAWWRPANGEDDESRSACSLLQMSLSYGGRATRELAGQASRDFPSTQRRAILAESLRDVQMASLSNPIALEKATSLPGGPFGPIGSPFGRLKSIARSRIEGEFEELLQLLAPSPQLLKLAAHLFRDLWDQKMAASHSRKKALKAELSQIERKIEQLLDLLIEANHATDISLFKKRMREQEQKKIALEDQIARCGIPLAPFDESFRTAMDFIGNPQKMWVSESLDDKRALLRLAFSGHLTYVRNEGFRTADFSFPFRVLGEEKSTQKGMVHPR